MVMRMVPAGTYRAERRRNSEVSANRQGKVARAKHAIENSERGRQAFLLLAPEPVVLASNHGFSPVELNTVGQLLRDNRNQILEAWDEHCGTRR
jgi:hypothetical protein